MVPRRTLAPRRPRNRGNAAATVTTEIHGDLSHVAGGIGCLGKGAPAIRGCHWLQDVCKTQAAMVILPTPKKGTLHGKFAPSWKDAFYPVGVILSHSFARNR